MCCSNIVIDYRFTRVCILWVLPCYIYVLVRFIENAELGWMSQNAIVRPFPNCNNLLTDEQIKNIHLSVSIASAVCLLVITFILLLLIFYKTYKTTLQWLFLYLTITTVIQEACMTMDFEHQFQYSEQEIFCKCITFASLPLWVMTARLHANWVCG